MDVRDKFVRRARDDGAGVDVPVVCSFRRPDSGERHRSAVLPVEPYRCPAAGFILSPLVEAVGGNQAAALPERVPE